MDGVVVWMNGSLQRRLSSLNNYFDPQGAKSFITGEYGIFVFEQKAQDENCSFVK